MLLDRKFEIPPFSSAGSLFVAASEDLAPVDAISAAEAAERHLEIFDTTISAFRPFTFDRAPFLRRPLEAFSSGLYRLVATMGPSQTAKSTLLMAAQAYTVRYAPADWVCMFPDQVTSRAFSTSKWQPTVEASDDIAERLLKVRDAMTAHRQKFRQMTTWYIWPVASQLRFRTCRYFLADDFDAIPEDIDGEGDPVSLLFGRTPAYEGREVGLLASSPSLGRDKGIEKHVASGTDERLHAPCPQCGSYFELDLEAQLQFDRTSSAADAAESVHVVCPVNGCVIEPKEKEHLRSHAVFAAPCQTVRDDGTVSGDLPVSSVASFRIDGLVSFVSWSRLAELLRSAEIEFDKTQSEGALRTFYNTRAGKNYKVRAETKAPIEAEGLSARALRSTYQLGTIPDWARYMTAAVDVQGNRFAVASVAWGDERQAAVVDRFDILEYREGPVRPHLDAEVWNVLRERVFDRVIPFRADETKGLWPAVVAIDSQGLDGVTVNARKFARAMRAAGVPDWRVMLTKGAKSATAEALGKPSFETDDKGKRIDDGVPISIIGVNDLKSTLDTRLRFSEPGPGYIHFPSDFSDEHFEELTAEEIVGGRWEKKAPKIANETLDLMVGNMVAQMRLRVDRVDWSDPPVYAVPVAIRAEGQQIAPPVTRGRRVRSKGIG